MHDDVPVTFASAQYAEWLEWVRRKPGMYIGPTDQRAVCWFITELMYQWLYTHPANTRASVHITADGAMYRVHIAHVDTAMVPLSPLLTTHFWQRARNRVPTVAAIAAMSELLELQIGTGTVAVQQRFVHGMPATPVHTQEHRGTPFQSVAFTLNEQVMQPQYQPARSILASRLRELAALAPSLTITLTDRPSGITETFRLPQGISDYLLERTFDLSETHAAPFRVSGVTPDLTVDIALRWLDGRASAVYSYVNFIRTSQGGSHETGTWRGVRRALDTVAHEQRAAAPRRLPAGVGAVISIHMADLRNHGWQRYVLRMPALVPIISQMVAEQLPAQLHIRQLPPTPWRER